MERLVKLSMIYVLVVLFCVDQGRAYEVPQFIQKLLADASKTSSSASKTPVKNTSCDYIIVGAGSAGCVIANRLSANPDNTVCLLESGGLESEIHQMPVLTIALQSTPSNYGYTTVPQNHSCLSMNNNSCGIPQGKSLGGSSSINYSIYNRGNIEGYDKWAAAGNEGWSYKDVLKYFKRAENSSLSKYPESPYHNSSGSYRSTEDVKYRTKIGDAFIRSCKESGLKYIDYNAPHNDEGCSYTQASTLNGRRHSSYSAYIDPILEDRANLHVLPYSLVTKILIDSDTKTAYGVNFEHLGEKFTIMASKEVILSAGTFHSAQLLMVSGVGPKDVLDNIGVPVVIDLPVGKTYQDHSSAIIPLFTVNTTLQLQTLYIDRVTPIDIVEFEAGDDSTIVSSISAIEASAFFRDFELIMVSATISVDYGTTFRSGINMRLDVYNKYYKQLEEVELFGFLTKANYPESKGSVWVESSDVKVPPKINPT